MAPDVPLLNFQILSADGPGTDGDAPALVIVHGLFGSGDNWLSLARKWSSQRPVALVDLPNHGASPWTGNARYEEMALLLDATAARISAEVGGRPLAMLGHSMGGKLVMALALKAPDLPAFSLGAYSLDCIIVADIAPRSYEPAHHAYFDAMNDLPLERLESRGDADRHMAQSVPDKALRAFLIKNLARDEDGNFSWKLNLPVLISDYSHILGWDIGGSSDVPALFLKGADSPYVEARRDGDRISALFPYARIETVEAAGHWLHAERPGEVLRLVADFLHRSA
jgi:esterase